jgi:hypothetical protein
VPPELNPCLLVAMADALDGMRMAGMASEFGSVPKDVASAEMQAKIYVNAANLRFSEIAPSGKQLNEKMIMATAEWFTTRRPEDGTGYRFPSSPEFADRLCRVYKSNFKTITVGSTIDELGYEFWHTVDVPVAMPEDRLAELVNEERLRLGISDAPKALGSVQNDFLRRDLAVPRGKSTISETDEQLAERKAKLAAQIAEMKSSEGGETE